MNTTTRIFPAHWAPYLINGDSSFLKPYEIREINQAVEGLGSCLEVSKDSWYQWGHDADKSQGADVCTYTFAL